MKNTMDKKKALPEAMRFQLIQEFAQIDELTREERVDRYLEIDRQKLLASTTSLVLLQNVSISIVMGTSFQLSWQHKLLMKAFSSSSLSGTTSRRQTIVTCVPC